MLTVTAVYKDGALIPMTKLNLPNDTQVQLQIVDMQAATLPGASAFGSLAGIWADLSDDDLSHAQQAIAKSRQKSSRKIKQLTQRPVRGQ